VAERVPIEDERPPRLPAPLPMLMLRWPLSIVCPLLLFVPLARPALAQVVPGWDSKQFRIEQLDSDRIRLTGQVEIEGEGPNAGQKFFADDLEWNLSSGEFSASGNVVVSTPTSRIAAERAVFNTKTRLGTFHTASGIASLGERGQEDRTMFGSLEPEVYFYGEMIEKIGDDKYRITRGGFTTCVQPTPRWEVVSNSATINLGDYAILRNAVMRVKDVPVFYLPVLYYPIQDDDRATGFLLPTYGNSTYRGASISNAFFWAINRSQDATLFHDWFTTRGQGMGSEYRYALAPGSEGMARAYWLNQKASTVDGVASPSVRSYQIESGVVQRLPGRLSARARIDYFSDITSQQLYNNNIYEQSRSQRTIDGSVSGAWSGWNVTGNYRRIEQFYTPTDSLLNGNAPSLTANLSSRRLGGLPVYFALNTESARVLYVERREAAAGIDENDFTLNRVDFNPSLRAPLTSLPFLTLTGTLAYRYTYYSERWIADRVQVPDPISRQYADLRAELVGPVLSRVFTPNNAFADRLKHLVEPSVSVQRTTSIDNFDQIPNLGGYYDTIFGGVTRVSYGVTNRFLVRKAGSAGAAPAASAPREFLNVGVSQTYYSDERASRFDQQYQSSSFGTRPPSNFSPVALTVRASPTAISTANLRLEYDYQNAGIQSLGAQGGLNHPRAQVTAGWSRTSQLNFSSNVLDASTTLRFSEGRTGGAYSVNWDIERGHIVQQRWIGFYNAQCCGLTVEYQEFNFSSDPRFGVPKDRRFNIGFTLAGIGTFSNFFGTFGGPRY
jgi:lipopolysaccharide assembly outer membrane protein LptD (OstA)